jgi:threonine aldolase
MITQGNYCRLWINNVMTDVIQMIESRNFASDNSAPVHEKIMQAMEKVNTGDAISYGSDPYTISVTEKFKKIFGRQAEVFFVFNGTGANVVSLASVVKPFDGILCSENAHINTDECGAPERFGGFKLIPLPAVRGKIQASQILKHTSTIGNEHHSQPKLVSITQSTEYGTLYTLAEIKEIIDCAHKNGMLVHMDGARLANAAAALGAGLGEITAGVDILSFGGTKNGMMFGEAVVVLNKDLAYNCRFVRKQAMQLASKIRYIAAQFDALLEDSLWLKNAVNANNMAKLLAQEAGKLPGVRITNSVDVNAVFAVIPAEVTEKLVQRFFFHVWDEQTNEVRWMTSYKTSEKDVHDFVEALRECLKPV